MKEENFILPTFPFYGILERTSHQSIEDYLSQLHKCLKYTWFKKYANIHVEKEAVIQMKVEFRLDSYFSHQVHLVKNTQFTPNQVKDSDICLFLRGK